MPIDFPNNPSLNETFTAAGKTWKWNGFAWDSITIAPQGATGATGATLPGGLLYQSTYYKSANQNLTNGSTDITFDSDASWNNSNGYITHASGSKDFVVVQPGLYQLEWNASVIANGATWNANTNKIVSIDITRSPISEQIVIGQTAVVASTQNFTQSVVSTFNLQAGDIINLRHFGNFSTATPFAQGVQNTIDFNTWFTWRYVSTGPLGLTGATGPQGSPGGATGATGASAIIPANPTFTTVTTTGQANFATTTTSGEAKFGIPVETKATPTIFGAVLSLNLQSATFFYVTLDATAQVVFLNPPISPRVFSFTLQFVGSGTGVHAITWPTSIRWGPLGEPVLSTTINKVDTFSFMTHDGGVNWFGFINGQDF